MIFPYAFHAITTVTALTTIILNQVDLSSYHVTDLEVDEIIGAIKNHSIEELNISSNNFTAHGVVQIIQALSKTIMILDISSSFKHSSSNEINELANLLATDCHSLKELNLSHNTLTFNNVLQIVQGLRGHPTLKRLDLSNNITSYFLECEFLIDIILSVNHLLEIVNICGRNIRPRFNDDCLFFPEENSNRFALQNLYFTGHVLMNGTVSNQLKNYIKVQEICPVPNKSITSYYVDHNGDTIYNKDHDFAIVIPPGAVLKGQCVEIQANASWFNFYELQDKYYFYKIPDGCKPISSFFWLSAHYMFKLPVYLILSHHAALRNSLDINNLCVLHGYIHDQTNNEGEPIVMEKVSDGVFFDNSIRYCIFTTHHFCSFCMINEVTAIPDKFLISIYKYNIGIEHFVEVCFCPAICECRQVTSYIILCTCHTYCTCILTEVLG